MADLRARIQAELDRREAIARAAAEAKPGTWQALSTHDGIEWTGHSHIRAQETCPDRTVSRPVAYKIAGSLMLTRVPFTTDRPPAAVTAEHIALHDPGDALAEIRLARDVMNLAAVLDLLADSLRPDLAEQLRVPVNALRASVGRRYGIGPDQHDGRGET